MLQCPIRLGIFPLESIAEKGRLLGNLKFGSVMCSAKVYHIKKLSADEERKVLTSEVLQFCKLKYVPTVEKSEKLPYVCICSEIFWHRCDKSTMCSACTIWSGVKCAGPLHHMSIEHFQTEGTACLYTENMVL